MTTEEKRMKLVVKCASRPCTKKCPLYDAGIRCGEGTSFLKKKPNGRYDMPDKDIALAYAIMFEGKKVENKEAPSQSTAHGCQHNAFLICCGPASKCKSCGWNPAVSEARRKKIKWYPATQTKKSKRAK